MTVGPSPCPPLSGPSGALLNYTWPLPLPPQALQGRYYDGRPIIVEFSPVTDFREATCRQYEENTCNRGGYCNFMHLKPIS